MPSEQIVTTYTEDMFDYENFDKSMYCLNMRGKFDEKNYND